MVDLETGLLSNSKTKNVIYESFKQKDNFMIDLDKLSNKVRLGSYDSGNERKILRFY